MELGYGMYTFLQMAMYIIGFSLLLTTLFHFHVKQIMIKVSLCMYAFIPVFPVYALLVGGDAFLPCFSYTLW